MTSASWKLTLHCIKLRNDLCLGNVIRLNTICTFDTVLCHNIFVSGTKSFVVPTVQTNSQSPKTTSPKTSPHQWSLGQNRLLPLPGLGLKVEKTAPLTSRWALNLALCVRAAAVETGLRWDWGILNVEGALRLPWLPGVPFLKKTLRNLVERKQVTLDMANNMITLFKWRLQNSTLFFVKLRQITNWEVWLDIGKIWFVQVLIWQDR